MTPILSAHSLVLDVSFLSDQRWNLFCESREQYNQEVVEFKLLPGIWTCEEWQEIHYQSIQSVGVRIRVLCPKWCLNGLAYCPRTPECWWGSCVLRVIGLLLAFFCCLFVGWLAGCDWFLGWLVGWLVDSLAASPTPWCFTVITDLSPIHLWRQRCTWYVEVRYECSWIL